MATNLLPISSDGGFITAGNITTASYASPAPSLSGFSSVISDNISLINGDISGGIATVVDDGINSIQLALGAQMDVFGFPFSQTTRGQLTISDVTTPSEVNGTWYYQSVNTNTYQIYTDNTYSTLVDATGWSAYTGGGTVAIVKQNPAANIVINSNGYLTKFNNNGQVILPDNSRALGLLTSSFTGTIAGTTLTVTGATPGTIAWEQSIEGPGVAADTFIVTQLTGTSGGNGTYSVTVSQNIGPVTMNVAAMYLNGGLKLGVNHAIYQQDEDDTSLYNFLIGIEAQEATIHIGDINTNGVCIPNDKEYKGHSNLNPGTFMAFAKVNANDEVILSSGNAANTLIRVGGDSATTGYAMKFNNGGEGLIPTGLRIGDNTNATIFNAPLEISSILGAEANNQSRPSGIGMPTYRGTGTVIANDEWGSYLYGSRYRGTINSPLPTKNGDWLMEFGATSFDGTNNNGGGEIAFRVAGTVTGSSNPSNIEFYNTVTGSNSQTLGMVLDSSQKLTVTGNIAGANISTTGNITGNTNGFAIGYLNIPQVAASNTTIALTDAGKHYYSTSAGNFTLTVPNNTTTSFATGTAISIVVQSAGNVLVNAASGVTLYMAGNSTAANRVVSNYGMATLMKVATDTWMINGTGVA